MSADDSLSAAYSCHENSQWLGSPRKTLQALPVTHSTQYRRSSALTCWPGLQEKLAMLTSFPSTVMCPWLTSCRAAAMVGAKPRRNTVLSSRISSSCSRISPVEPFCFLHGWRAEVSGWVWAAACTGAEYVEVSSRLLKV